MGPRKTLVIGVTVNLEHYENLRLEVSGETESVSDADHLAAYLDEVLGRMGRNDPATAERIDSYRKRVLSRATEAQNPATTTGCHHGVCPLPPVILPDVMDTAPNLPMPPIQKNPVSEMYSLFKQPEKVTTASGLRSSGADVQDPPSQILTGSAAGGDPGVRRVKTGPLPKVQDTSAEGLDVRGGPATSVMEGVSSIGTSAPSVTGAGSSGNKPPATPGNPGTSVPGIAAGTPTDEGSGQGTTVSLESRVCELCLAPISEAERKTSQLFTSKNLCRICMKRN